MNMIRLSPILFALILAVFCKTDAQSVQPFQSATHSIVKFDGDDFNFGEIKYGSDARHKFAFKNISKQTIAIREVKTSCGCTTPEYDTRPIRPGRTGYVVAKYDSKRQGQFVKNMTVLMSDGEQIVLTIRGSVQGPEKVALPR